MIFTENWIGLNVSRVFSFIINDVVGRITSNIIHRVELPVHTGHTETITRIIKSLDEL